MGSDKAKLTKIASMDNKLVTKVEAQKSPIKKQELKK